MTDLRLSPVGTVRGLRERLFLHELITPAYADHDRGDWLEAIRLIQ